MRKLEETMRWYGPDDPVSLSDIRQAGASGIVTALHNIPNGHVWPIEAILERKDMIEKAGMRWLVVESVPIHEDIKLRNGQFQEYIENYKETIRNLAEAGIEVICYNFMPVLDWTRTDLNYTMPDGGKTLRFDPVALAAFDVFILQRKEARKDYSADVLEGAKTHYESLDDESVVSLTQNILAGLPGAEESYSLDDFKASLARYQGMDSTGLEDNLSQFLDVIIPVARKYGIRMALHPDDPPYPIFGLPRVVSTQMDIARVLKNPDDLHNGLTFCTGSFGVRPDNDLLEMVKSFRDRIYFVHLRSTKRNASGSFVEAAHLDGDVTMYEIMVQLMEDNSTRKTSIPMRPDHGHQILDDLHKTSNPGYSAIGRLKGLAELRGLMYAIDSANRANATK